MPIESCCRCRLRAVGEADRDPSAMLMWSRWARAASGWRLVWCLLLAMGVGTKGLWHWVLTLRDQLSALLSVDSRGCGLY